jgi:hypothetical protein
MSVLQSLPLKHVGIVGHEAAYLSQYFFQESALLGGQAPAVASQQLAVAEA